MDKSTIENINSIEGLIDTLLISICNNFENLSKDHKAEAMRQLEFMSKERERLIDSL